MLTPFYEARAWRIATQIVRRAPARLTLLESEFMDGHYILHSIVPRDTAGPLEAYEHRLIDVNRHGTILGRADRELPPALKQAGREPALLFDRAQDFYRKLTAELGLPDPRPLPPSTPETLAFRFAAAWLQLCSALGRSYACWQGVSAWLKVRALYFGAFPHPEIAALAVEQATDPKRWHPAHRFFFITDEAKGPGHGIPVACVGTDGLVRTPDGAVFDIPKIYRTSGRNIWAPVTAVRAHLESADLITPP
jgi:hypothetical protein